MAQVRELGQVLEQGLEPGLEPGTEQDMERDTGPLVLEEIMMGLAED